MGLRHSFFLFVVYLFLLCTVSCTADDDIDAPQPPIEESPKLEEPTNNVRRDSMRVLVIGNSLSRDAFTYVPFVIKELSPDTEIGLSILYIGGVGLTTHLNYILNGNSSFVLDQYDSERNRWESIKNTSGNNVIDSIKWDLLVLQEGSVKGRNYLTTIDNVRSLSNLVRAVCHDIHIAYMINPSHADGDKSLGVLTSEEVWNMYASTASELLEKGDVDYIIPCGTAIQNARHTYLDQLGDFGRLSYDGVHLQEGIPCLIDAYAATQSLLNIFNIDSSIENSNFRVSQKWVYSVNVPGMHGKVIIGSDADYGLCKKCALSAIDNPYLITINE